MSEQLDPAARARELAEEWEQYRKRSSWGMGRDEEDAFTFIEFAAESPVAETLRAAAGEIDRLKTQMDFTYCAYCGHKCPCDGDGSDVAEHIRTCEKHPMRAVEAELARLRAG